MHLYAKKEVLWKLESKVSKVAMPTMKKYNHLSEEKREEFKVNSN